MGRIDTELSIGPVRLSLSCDGTHEAGAEVDGFPIRYTASHAVAGNADSLACAFLLPSLAADRVLVLDDPIDEGLCKNIPRIATICKEWWHYAPARIEACTVNRRPQGDEGLFFTSGVDSFFTLMRNRDRIRYLVNVHGFDIALHDTDRFENSAAAIETVAEQLSLEPIFVHTNLREHPTFNALPWPVTHIAALASVGHLLQPHLRRIHIAGSDVPPPHGSHPSLDCLWSSNAVEMINDEDGIRRLDKVRAIGDWDVAQRNLKVCWENRSANLNCSVCEKCVRTQAQLATAGVLEHFETFLPGSLAARIDNLPVAEGALISQWRDIRNQISQPTVRSAVDRLLARSAFDIRLHKIERRLWGSASFAGITPRRLKELDARLFGGRARRLYQAFRHSAYERGIKRARK